MGFGARARVVFVEALGSEPLMRRRMRTMTLLSEVIAGYGREDYAPPPAAEPLLRVTSGLLAGGVAELLIAWIDGALRPGEGVRRPPPVVVLAAMCLNLGMPQLEPGRGRTARLLSRCAGGVALLAAGSLALGGCASTGTARSADAPPLVLTTFTVIADMTREVAGDRVEVASITKPGAEIHGYEPTPSDLKKAAHADLVLENGLGLERWFAPFVDLADAPSATLTAGIRPIPIGGGSEYAGKPNPHAWMSTDNAQIYVENIRRALTKLDPDGAAEYRRRADAYAARLRTVGERVRRRLRDVPADRRVLVTCEGAFSYLARDLGLREAYLWPVNAEQEGTPQQIAATVEVVRRRQVPGVFCESTVNAKAQKQVADEAGSRFAGTLYVDSLSAADGPVPTYLDLLRRDADTIARGLDPAAQETR